MKIKLYTKFLEDVDNEKLELATVSHEEMIISLKRDCRPFLDILKKSNGFLYRIASNSVPAYKQFVVPTNRSPRDFNKYTHDLLNKKLFDKFGIFGRSEVAFATNNPTQFELEGQVYLIFPIGDFKYLYNPKVSDLIVNFTSNSTIREIVKDRDKSNKISAAYNRLGFQDTPLDSEYDIYQINKSLPNSKEILIDEMKKALDWYTDLIISGFKDNELEGIIGSKKPVEIAFECARYYMVDFDYFSRELGFIDTTYSDIYDEYEANDDVWVSFSRSYKKYFDFLKSKLF